MTGFIAWGWGTLLASALLMVLVLALRHPVRRWLGPQVAYGLWALPLLRMLLPPLPLPGPAALLAGNGAGLSVLAIGPQGAVANATGPELLTLGTILSCLWLAGAFILLGIQAVRHWRFCADLRRNAVQIGVRGRVRVIVADVAGPLSFGIFRPCIAVPRRFTQDYSAREQELVLAHEAAHHARGDLVANWLSLLVLAAHWWNPVAWLAIRAFRADQEFAVDAGVLARQPPAAAFHYAQALARAAGIGALPACNLTSPSTLKARLIALQQGPRSRRRRWSGGVLLACLGVAGVFATAPGGTGHAVGRQAVTIGVKPDGAGGFALIVGGVAVAPGAPLPGGMVLPADFGPAGGCDLAATAKPVAMVIKGEGATRTYTIMCASAAHAPLAATLAEGLASLRAMRASVAGQQSPDFPAAEQAHALAAIDLSIGQMAGFITQTD